MTATNSALVTAVAAEMAEITSATVQSGASLTEGINDTLTIQVYPESGESAHNSRTDRNTFGKGLELRRRIVHIDVYARARAHIGEDMVAVTSAADDVEAKLNEQQSSPPFGVAGVKTWHYTWQRVIFSYGGVEYVGIRFVLTFVSS